MKRIHAVHAGLGAAILALAAVPGSAEASTFPGANGRLVWVNFAEPTPGTATADLVSSTASGADRVRLTSPAGASDAFPGASADGRRIVFTRQTHASTAGPPPAYLYVMNADGSGQTQLARSSQDSHPTFSPDGGTIAYEVGGTGFEAPNAIWVVRSDGSGAHQLIPSASQPTFSPDGRRIAYVARDHGRYPLRIADADGTHPQTVDPDGEGASWSPDGTHLAYSVNTFEKGVYKSVLTVRSVAAGKLGKPRVLASSTKDRYFDAVYSPDGTTILVAGSHGDYPNRYFATVDPRSSRPTLRTVVPYDARTTGPDEPTWLPVPVAPQAASATVAAPGAAAAAALRRTSAARLRRRGSVRLSFHASAPGTVRVELRLGTRRVAEGSTRTSGSGRASVRVRLGSRGRRLLAHGRHVGRLTLRTSFTTPDGRHHVQSTKVRLHG